MREALITLLAGVLSVATPAIAFFLSRALQKLAARWGYEATAQDKANMEMELRAGLGFGISKILPMVVAQPADPATHANVLSIAAPYFIERFPDRTAIITAAAQQADPLRPVTPLDAVKDTLSARLPEALAAVLAPLPSPPDTTAADLNRAELARVS